MRSHKAEASEAGRLLASLGARKGGLASADALTPDERKARARNAIQKRWAGKRSLPVDQKAVMARARGVDSVSLKIAPGKGGVRRRAAIHALQAKGLIKVVTDAKTSVTVSLTTGVIAH